MHVPPRSQGPDKMARNAFRGGRCAVMTKSPNTACSRCNLMQVVTRSIGTNQGQLGTYHGAFNV